MDYSSGGDGIFGAIFGLVWIGVVLCSCGISLMFLAIWVFALFDVATKEPVDDKDRMPWLLIVLFGSGLGGLVYLLVRRPQRLKLYGK